MTERLSRLLRIRDVERMVGLKRRTIDRMERSGDFPTRVRLPGVRGVAWLEHEIQQLIEENAKRRAR